MSTPKIRLFIAVAGALLLALGVAACSINPATGKRQLALIGETREIEMGREADADIVRSLGLYDDPAIQTYVQGLGSRLAALSERPGLPWTFRVVDDPVVNAFALPGGYIYVTRGILTHLESEAELAAVVGHEIGHVTARHGVNQVSKAQLTTLGLGLGMILSPELREFGDVAELGMGLLFLKYSRDDEFQADDLGLRYMMRARYQPGQMPGVFSVLRDVSRVEGVGRLPNWLSTHPDPDARIARTERSIAALGGEQRAGSVGLEDYLRRIDGMVFGDNPREGFFRENLFLHPELRFSIELPAGWTFRNLKQSVSATSTGKDAVVQLTLAPESSPQAAADKFFQQQGVVRGAAWVSEIRGLPTVSAQLAATSGENSLRGLVAFVEYGGRVYRLLGYTSRERWSTYESAMARSLVSFDRLTDPRALDVQPRRVQVVRISRELSLREFDGFFPSTVPLETVALINHVSVDGRLESGRMVKRVVGGP